LQQFALRLRPQFGLTGGRTAIDMIGSSLVIPRQEEQLSPSADEAALPGELS
jgi:hypothetical protein